jgi:hypothetical protein
MRRGARGFAVVLAHIDLARSDVLVVRFAPRGVAVGSSQLARIAAQPTGKTPLRMRAHGRRPAFWSVALDAAFATLQRAAGIRPIS